MNPIGAAAAATPRGSDEQRARLHTAAKDLEGIFVNYLFHAMRESVPQDGVLEQSPGQEMFTGMLDEKLAELSAHRSHNGLGEALYRQMSRHLPAAPETAGKDKA
jgi:flagellar protein FlgJ